jgi:calcineurin-like phosphoesterase family protein
MLFFTSDTHFNDSKIIKQYGRVFSDIESMNTKLISNWNTVISPTDEVYILGDLMVGGNGIAANELLSQLNGIKYLIRGNHDDYADDKDFDRNLFKWVKRYAVLKYNGYRIVLFHFPIFEWDGFFSKNTIHLYGHIHNQKIYSKQRKRYKGLPKSAVNICTDLTNYYPVSIDSLFAYINNNTPFPIQHNSDDKTSAGLNDMYCMWHLTSINNLPSILEHGLLSREFLDTMKLKYVDNSPRDLTEKRHKLGMNSFVPFHFIPSNPYDLYEFQRNKDCPSSFCYITVEDKTAAKLGAMIEIEYPNHKPCLELINLPACKSKINDIRRHTDYGNRLQKFNALSECLIKDVVEPKYFFSIIVGTEENKNDIEEYIKMYNLAIPIELKPGYFANWYEKKIFYHKEIIERQRRLARGDTSLDDL